MDLDLDLDAGSYRRETSCHQPEGLVSFTKPPLFQRSRGGLVNALYAPCVPCVAPAPCVLRSQKPPCPDSGKLPHYIVSSARGPRVSHVYSCKLLTTSCHQPEGLVCPMCPLRPASPDAQIAASCLTTAAAAPAVAHRDGTPAVLTELLQLYRRSCCSCTGGGRHVGEYGTATGYWPQWWCNEGGLAEHYRDTHGWFSLTSGNA